MWLESTHPPARFFTDNSLILPLFLFCKCIHDGLTTGTLFWFCFSQKFLGGIFRRVRPTPQVAREITDARLAGVADLCAAGGDAGSGSSNANDASPPDGSGPAVIFAIVPPSKRLVVLRDSGSGDGGKKRRSEL